MVLGMTSFLLTLANPTALSVIGIWQHVFCNDPAPDGAMQAAVPAGPGQRAPSCPGLAGVLAGFSTASARYAGASARAPFF